MTGTATSKGASCARGCVDFVVNTPEGKHRVRMTRVKNKFFLNLLNHPNIPPATVYFMAGSGYDACPCYDLVYAVLYDNPDGLTAFEERVVIESYPELPEMFVEQNPGFDGYHIERRHESKTAILSFLKNNGVTMLHGPDHMALPFQPRVRASFKRFARLYLPIWAQVRNATDLPRIALPTYENGIFWANRSACLLAEEHTMEAVRAEMLRLVDAQKET